MHQFKEDGLISGDDEKKGCYVSPVKGFICVLCAIALAAIVGLIVYFEHPNRDKSESSQVVTDMNNVVEPTAAPINIRLPGSLVPEHYNVRLRPDIYTGDPKTFSFTGSVEVNLKCVQSTNIVTLHKRDLTIDESKSEVVDKDTSQMLTIASTKEDTVKEFYIINVRQQLQKGKMYIIKLYFNGPIKKNLKGIYYSSYTANSGETRYILTSQLQAVDARAVFPCMDEPSLKATFNTSVERKPHLRVISNMDLNYSEDLPGGWVVDHFHQSPPMSTYLVAITVSDFNCLNSRTTDNKLVEICARPNAINQGHFANNISANIQTFLQSYHNLSYPLPKATHMAVSDFSAGAMENWGLILYRETALLYDPSASTAAQKQRVAVVIAHELAHMWFGNLVTPSWWDDIWLNEGFASYMEYLGVNAVFPEWKMDDFFVVEKIHRVFDLDALAESHPVYQTVNSPDEISEIFDTITYSKGSSVIRMMRFFLGEDTFRQGIAKYLVDRAYQAADHPDLFNFLTQQARADGKDIDVARVMNTWILQMGYPLVTFSVDSTTGKITISQRHFLLNPNSEVKRPSPYNYKWGVPITYVTDQDTSWDSTPKHWLWDESMEVSINAGFNWIIANVEQGSYYRVNYDDDMWNRIINQLMTNHIRINSKNRAQILNDAFNLGRAGIVPQTLGLNATRYLQYERDYAPWRSVKRDLGHIELVMSSTGDYGYLRRYVQNIVTPIYDYLGWTEGTSSSHIDSSLRSQILSMACYYGLEACLIEAHSQFVTWMSNYQSGNTINPNLRRVVYCYGIAQGGEEEWDFAFARYKESNIAAEQRNLLQSLACSKTDWLLRRYLELALEEKEVRRQDFVIVLGNVAYNPLGKTIAWQFLMEHWDTIFSRFGASAFTFTDIIDSTTAGLSSDIDLKQVERFIQEHPNQGTGKAAFQQALENIQSNIYWKNKNLDTVTSWFQQELS